MKIVRLDLGSLSVVMIAALAASILAGSLPWIAVADEPSGTLAHVAKYAMESADGTVKGSFLKLYSATPRGAVQRTFMAAPGETLLTVTSVLDAPSGRDLTVITHEASGWWAELVLRTEETAESLRAYIDRGLWSDSLDYGEGRLRLSNGTELDGRWILEDGSIIESLATSMLRGSLEGHIRTDVPDEMAAALVILDNLLRSTASKIGSMPRVPGATLVELLLRVAGDLEVTESVTDGPSRIRRETLEAGSRLTAPEHRDFVGQFGSVVDPAEPLTRSEVRSLLEPRR